MTKIENTLEILILQHPQEKSKDLATAPVLVQSLSRCQIRVGLSWANLAKAVGRPVDPKKWGVLFVGSQASSQKIKSIPQGLPLEGVIALDGNWSQAKALWWRNAWLLKLHRIVLNPKKPSLYNKLRREPRKNCISTLESVVSVLEMFGSESDKKAASLLQQKFEEFVAEKLLKAKSPHEPLPSRSSEETEKA
ncbi:MAG TPA: tRNA-uridine aminocarboxypropyltransferase [Oligoflexia bacterium]|nr:tRNA-uridine aminocarboxypropyltransferase [Oligoflexia bacterium]